MADDHKQLLTTSQPSSQLIRRSLEVSNEGQVTDNLPAILDEPAAANFPALIAGESELLAQARKLFDASYGWAAEQAAAKTLKQFGAHVPPIAFTEVYQEILAVWCGNYWGRSTAHVSLSPFIDKLNTKKLIELAGMFRENDRVRAELFQMKPKKQAINLLENFKGRVRFRRIKTNLIRLLKKLKTSNLPASL